MQSKYQKELSDAEFKKELFNVKVQYETELEKLCGKPNSNAPTPVLDSVMTPDGIDTNKLAKCYWNIENPNCPSNVPFNEMKAECVRGQIGEQILTLQGVYHAVTSARNAWVRAQEQFDEATQHCIAKQQAFQEDAEMLERHLDHVASLRKMRIFVDTLANIATAAKDCASSAFLSFGSSCGFAAAEAMYRTMSMNIQNDIDEANDDYQQVVARRSNEEIIRDCFYNADQYKYTIDAQMDALREASHTISSAKLTLENLRDHLMATANQAYSSVRLRETMRVIPPEHHFWYDEKISLFKWRFDWAKRLTYLAMLAAEYESQQTLIMRTKILKAKSPKDLLDMHQVIASLNVPGSIYGTKVDYYPLVLNLRDELLMIPQLSTSTTNKEGQSKEAAFQAYLKSNATVLYENGKRVGQAIRFSLRPFGPTALKCAEHIWRVSASISMDPPPPNGQAFSLRHSNIFGSKLCSSSVPKLQMAQVRPENNLLLPAKTSGIYVKPLSQTPLPFSKLTVEPFFNMTRDQLVAMSPDSGFTGLAGRGLYGDYMIVFPDNAILQGFDFSKVKNILLRFEIIGGSH